MKNQPFDISDLITEFNQNYLSEYRWVKDRINTLSAEDWLNEKIQSKFNEGLKVLVGEIEALPSWGLNDNPVNIDKIKAQQIISKYIK